MESKNKKKVNKVLRAVSRIYKKRKSDDRAAELIRPNFYSRFRFDLPELIEYLKISSGKKFLDIPNVFQCLDDLGYWSFVRESEVFNFTQELELMITTQFKYLSDTFDYHNSDILLYGKTTNEVNDRHLVKVIDKVVQNNNELYRVEVLNSGASILVSRNELDYWNGAGSSLPVDTLVEAIDWTNDKIWQKKLSDFKLFMINKKFKFNFLGTDFDILNQQKELVENINYFFNFNKLHPTQRGKGIGLLSCGSGSDQDQLVVSALAMQALAQPFGISSRLWGQREGLEYKPLHLLTHFGRMRMFLKAEEPCSVVINNFELYPIQRTLSEVLKKILAKGPFGITENSSLGPEFAL